MKNTRATGRTIIMTMVLMAGSAATAQEHAHKSPHGGQVITVGSYHYEFLVKPGEIDVYVLDGKENVLPPKGMEGTLLVQLPDKTKKDVTLEPTGDYFKAPLDTSAVGSFIAIANIKIAGKPNVGRFSWAAKTQAGTKNPEEASPHHHEEHEHKH